MFGRFGLFMALLAVVLGVKAAEPAPSPALERYELQVQGVGSLPDFAAVQTVLRGLPGVKQLRLLSLEGDRAVFVLNTAAVKDVEAALSLETRLPIPGGQATNESVEERQARLQAGNLVPRMWQPDTVAH